MKHIPLFSDAEFESAKLVDDLPLQCSYCRETFYKTKRSIHKFINPNESSTGEFCSKSCRSFGLGIKVKSSCNYCSEELIRLPSQCKEGQNHYCNISCQSKSMEDKVKVSCMTCGIEFKKERAHFERSEKHFCSNKCSTGRFRIDKEAKELFNLDCAFKFNVYDYPNYFDLSLAEKHGWYSNIDNPKGVSRDHKVSKMYAFRNGLDPAAISHPANCEIMLHSDNMRKKTKCSITYEQLLIDIDNFNSEIFP